VARRRWRGHPCTRAACGARVRPAQKPSRVLGVAPAARADEEPEPSDTPWLAPAVTGARGMARAAGMSAHGHEEEHASGRETPDAVGGLRGIEGHGSDLTGQAEEERRAAEV